MYKVSSREIVHGKVETAGEKLSRTSRFYRRVLIPYGELHMIELFIAGEWSSIRPYRPSLEIFRNNKCVTGEYIKLEPQQLIVPTAHNLNMAMQIIDEAEAMLTEEEDNE